MKTQLLQDLQESGSTAPVAGEAVPTSAQPRRKPVVLAEEPRVPSVLPPGRSAAPSDDVRTPSVPPSQRPVAPADDARVPSVPPARRPVAPVDDAHTATERPRRPAVWHGPAAQRVDAGTPSQPLAPRAAPRAPDIAARGAGVAIEAWADRVAQAGSGESRPARAQQPGGVAGPERPTMDVAAFFGRDERRDAAPSPGRGPAAAAPAQAGSSDDSALGHDVAPPPRMPPTGSTHDAVAGAAAVPRRPHLSDVPAAGAAHEHAVGPVPPPVAAPGIAGDAPVLVRPADGSVPGVPVHERVAAQPDDTTLLNAPADERVPAAQWRATPPASAPDVRTERMLENVAAPFPAAVDTPVSPWRRLWKRRVVAWSVAGGLAAGVGGGVGWLYAGSRAESVPVAANTVPAAAARGAQAYVAREPAATVKAPAPELAPAPAPSAVAPIDAVKPPAPAEPELKPAPPAPAPDVAPAASRSVATVDLDPPKRAARHAPAARKRAVAKPRREATPEVRPAKAEPSPRERREETLMQCRAHGYDERQCIRRGCAMTRYGFACRG
jgi:hypothetical protein